ncbi:preprotein translocase subunit SecE [Montanilutibacter psychrotolerans]|uniref:Protein translocase subunit SecE n=1 Tax=Montanilutibacter psychrotolerans TaxID=1327343 RepID=A0A3M8SLH6_9GAMM|nr:preprotein translocase subunit SecE [Lysobacter psychrotolerans]RNF81633.1 preprotein translocase subunit SecE [Lysobacter psychrotolerans]
MNSKVEQSKTGGAGDLVKLALALVLVAAGVVAYIWFSNLAGELRSLMVVAGLVLGAALFMTTVKGAQTREFLSESRFELRKVVWPTRQEAMRTTWVVMIAVALLSLILAGFDVVIQFGVKYLLAR